MLGGRDGFEAHRAEHHPNYFLTSVHKLVERKFYCPLDDNWYSNKQHLARAITRAGWSNERYLFTHGEEHFPDLWRELNNDPKYGNSRLTPTCLECNKRVKFQEMKWEYPKFCGFSCSAKWHAKHTDRIEQAQETWRERIAVDPDYGLRQTQHRYWVLKGFTEEEATEKIKERQSTGSMARYVKIHGEEEGPKRFAARQQKWFASLKASGLFTGYSRVSVEMFQKIAESIPDLQFGKDEMAIRCGNRVISVDCLKGKKVIEFFGDYWHCNPLKYPATHMVKKRSAAQIWEHDAARIRIIEDAGYQVLTIWEKEYKDNPDLVIGKCIGYLL